MAHLGFLLTRSLSASSGSRSFQLLAEAAAAKNYTVSVCFVNDGVYQCMHSDHQELYGSSLEKFLEGLAVKGADILVSNPCLAARGLEMENVSASAKVVTFEAIAELIGKADQVVCL